MQIWAVSYTHLSNTVGLVIDTELTGECGYSSEFLLDIVFACYNAYPKQWIKDSDGNVVYGSVTSEAKDALAYIRQLYSDGIIDNDFLLRTTTNICEPVSYTHLDVYKRHGRTSASISSSTGWRRQGRCLRIRT